MNKTVNMSYALIYRQFSLTAECIQSFAKNVYFNLQKEKVRRMERIRAVAECVVDELRKRGVAHAECYCEEKINNEVVFNGDMLSMFRTNTKDILCLKAVDSIGRVGKVKTTRLDQTSIADVLEHTIEIMRDSEEYIWEGVSEGPLYSNSVSGILVPQKEELLNSANQLITDTIISEGKAELTDCEFIHTLRKRTYLNSNDVCFHQMVGYYSISRNGNVRINKLNQNIYDLSKPDLILDKNLLGIEPVQLDKEFRGTLLLSPKAVQNFWWRFRREIFNDDILDTMGTDPPPIKWYNMFGKKVADSQLTLEQRPRDPRFIGAETFTEDGYLNKNFTIIDKGEFQQYPLSGRMARRLGKKQNTGPHIAGASAVFNFVIKPGKTSIEDMIKSINQGILMLDFRETPAAFTGEIIAPISFGVLIENGKLIKTVRCIMETNVYEIMYNIRNISKETVNNGIDEMPWMAFDGVSYK